MNLRRLLLPAAMITTVSSGMLLGGCDVNAQDFEQPGAPPPPGRVSLFDPAPDVDYPSQSTFGPSRMTPEEMRVARAIFRANQRVARMEHNLWMGHEPLRPRWNAVPMMSTRYTNPKFYVPVYIYNR